jgi:hypothetical protein
MEENGGHKSFWTTLPGILTGLAGVIVAITGLIGGLVAGGEIGGPPEPPPLDQVNTSTNSQTIPMSNPAHTLAPTPTPMPTAASVSESIPTSIPSPGVTTAPARFASPESPLPASANTASCQDAPLMGTSQELPRGGASFMDAMPISPGLYILKRPLEQYAYEHYKVGLKADRFWSLRLEPQT